MPDREVVSPVPAADAHSPADLSAVLSRLHHARAVFRDVASTGKVRQTLNEALVTRTESFDALVAVAEAAAEVAKGYRKFDREKLVEMRYRPMLALVDALAALAASLPEEDTDAERR